MILVDLDEADRQLVVVALARLARERPGWAQALEDLAARFGGAVEYVALLALPLDDDGDAGAAPPRGDGLERRP